MKRMSRVCCTVALLLMTTGGVHEAGAALQAFSPAFNDTLGHIPTWYQDKGGLAVQPCLGAVADAGPCGLARELVPGGVIVVFDPTLPAVFPGNIPSEFFYYSATTSASFALADGSGALVTLALEAAFVDATGAAVLPTAVGATGSTFQRIRVRLDAAPAAGTYTLQHPWGEFTFTCPTVGVRCTFTRDIPAAAAPPVDFSLALGGAVVDSMSTFLLQSPPPLTPGLLGDGVTESLVIGGPGTVRTSVIIIPPLPLTPSTNTLFVVVGKKIGMDVTPTPTADFGGAVVDVTPTQVPVSVTNLTGAPMLLTGAVTPAIQFSGPNAADFSAAPPATGLSCIGATLGITAADSKCTFNAVFKPAASTVAVRTAKLTITPNDTTNAPPTSIALTGEAEFPITVEVEANGALKKILTVGDIPAVSENADAGTTLKYLPVPNDVVPNVSKYRPLVKVNNLTVTPTADGSFSIDTIGAAQFVDISFIRPGDVSIDPATGTGDNLVNITDALEALKIVSGINSAPTDAQLLAADVGPLVGGKPTADGLVDISDVLAILWRSISQPPTW